MKVLLTALNSKYIHTNLAVRSLQQFAAQRGYRSEIAEYTINQHLPDLIDALYRQRPDVLLLSCYIWNIGMMMELAEEYRQVCPEVTILAGGPEVSFHSEELLRQHPALDGILYGEGEVPFLEYLQYQNGERPLSQVHSLVWRDGEQIVCNPTAGPLPMEQLPFAYSDLEQLQNRILYFESIRGCPFRCSYCLSSVAGRVRYMPLELAFQRLQRFLDARVPQVKFVDRTFNLDAARAEAIWRFLIEHDNGVTSFQMELGGDLLTPGQLELLRTARPGLFQFEIGVQSTCGRTLEEICRKTDIIRLTENLRVLRDAGNIPLHLDLIAGLPLEGFTRFAQSFDDVFALRPHQLQLGFLKLLRGSALYAKRAQYGLVHSEAPPYEILRTPQLSFAELARLKIVEEMTEAYYNSGRFSHTLSYTLALCPSPFYGLLALGEAAPARSVGKYERYDLLYDFCIARGGDPAVCRWLLKYDLCLHERPRRLPACCPETAPAARRAVRSGTNKHVELFPFDVTDPARAPGETALLFDYTRRDICGHARAERIRL